MATKTLHDPLIMEVRACLSRRGYTQADLASALNISRGAIVRRMTGDVPFSHEELRKTAAFLGVTVGSLYGENAA